MTRHPLHRAIAFTLAGALALALTACSNPSAWMKGLWPELADKPQITPTPTPTPTATTVATPVIVATGGVFDSAQTVTITCATSGASIYYTTDGVTVPSTSSTAYSAPFTVAPGQYDHIKAIGVLAGTSSVISAQVDIRVRSWVMMGASSITGAGTASPSLIIAPDGSPYVGLVDGGAGAAASVLYTNGVGWPFLGSQGFTGSAVSDTSIAMDVASECFLAFQDNASTNLKVWEWTGSWAQLGSPYASTGLATNPSLAINPVDQTPWIAYVDGTASNHISVSRFINPSWGVVGGSGFTPATASSPSLAINSGGTPYVAFSDTYFGGAISVMSYSGSWADAGSSGLHAHGFEQYPSLVIDSHDMVFLASSDNTLNLPRVYYLSAGAWSELGSASAASGGNVDLVSLAISKSSISLDALYLAYTHQSGTDYGVCVLKFNAATAIWEPIGQSDFFLETSQPQYISLAVSPVDGTVWISTLSGSGTGATSVWLLQ